MVDDLTFHEHRDEVADRATVVLLVNRGDHRLAGFGRGVREPAAKPIRQLVESPSLFCLVPGRS
jgi:hypothetical protein